MKPALVALADGTVLAGTQAGSDGVATGEIVFNTAMAGYQEIITDPSYAGRVVTFTASHIGNYGFSHDDEQSDRVHAKGVVMRSMSRHPSSWRSEGSLDEYLAAHSVVAVTGIDTRRLTRRIRRFGAMPVAIGSDVDAVELIEMAAEAPQMAGRDLVSSVTTRATYRTAPWCPRRGHDVPTSGSVFLSLPDRDKPIGVEVARILHGLGFKNYATHGTAGHLARNSIPTTHVDKVGEGSYDPVQLIENGRIDLVINTPAGGKARGDGRLIRMAATRYGIASVTTATGGLAVARSIGTSKTHPSSVTSLQDHHRTIGGS